MAVAMAVPWVDVWVGGRVEMKVYGTVVPKDG